MDEETTNKILIAAIILLILMTGFSINLLNKNLETMKKVSDPGQIIDIIYQQCSEEGNINLTSIKGRTKTLEYTNGICVIK